jgi:hypothetical protein
MPVVRSAEEIANPEIVDAELHPDSRLRYIQRRMQAEEGLRLTIDNIAYVLKLDQDFESGRGEEPAS